MTLETRWSLAGGLALLLFALPARARCNEGSTSSCVGPGGCRGERTCNSGYLSTCECSTGPACQRCGRQSYLDAAGKCALPEICNGCDDDGNGQVDDGVYCLGTGPFTPRCTGTPAWQWIPMTSTNADFLTVGLGTTNARLPVDFNDPTHYANNLRYTARVHTSSSVRTLKLAYDDRDVDAFDAFTAFNRTNSEVTDQNGGVLGVSTFSLLGAGQVGGVELRFSTGPFFTRVGWGVMGAGVVCGATATSGAAPLEEDGVDSFGVLSGSDDVIFFQLVAGAEPLSVWMQGVEVAGFDADLYARWDALPERGAYDYASKKTGHSDEWINVEAARPGHTLFIAVHSRSGAGGFNLRHARVKPEQRWSKAFGNGARPLRVATSFTATAAQISRISDMLAAGQRFLMGMTEGKVQLREIELYNRAGDCTCDGQGCDVCVRGISDRAFCQGRSMVTLFTDEWDSADPAFRFNGGRVLAHELGHCLLNLPDEYRDHGDKSEPACFHGDSRCAASAMADPMTAANLCSPFDHGRDAAPRGHVCASCPGPQIGVWSGQSCTRNLCNACFLGGPSSWDQLVSGGKVFSQPTGTPNANTYRSYRGMPLNLSLR